MPRLLYIEASPRKTRSHSLKVARTFLDAYKKTHPEDEIDKLDLWSTSLPEFDGAIVDAKYRILQGEEHTQEEAEAWQKVVETFNRFNSADKYLIATPMWNFGVPYKLKHYIDIITQPGLAYTPLRGEDYAQWGLVKDKPAVVISARGGMYPPYTPLYDWDFQGRYLDRLLRFIGFDNIQQIVVEPTAMTPEDTKKQERAAIEKVNPIAPLF